MKLLDSKKREIIASTEGNIPIPEKDNAKIGLNIYKKHKFPIQTPVANLQTVYFAAIASVKQGR